jgi:hypothetical protein
MAAIASTSWETSSAPALSTSLAVSARRGEQLGACPPGGNLTELVDQACLQESLEVRVNK